MSTTPQSERAPSRPVIFDYRSVGVYLDAMFRWKKQTDPRFSVRKLVADVPGCSPSLVTQVLKGRRKLTRDRVEVFASLLGLNRQESLFLDRWVAAERSLRSSVSYPSAPRRSAPQNHLLTHWLNIFVKDACRLKGFKPEPAVIQRLLGGIASEKQIAKSLKFLLEHGYLRKTVDGKIVPESRLTTTTDDVPDAKIRLFHKNALGIASRAIELFPPDRRRASAVVVSLNESSVVELKDLLKEFQEKLMQFVEDHPGETDGLYQVLINLTPVGGCHEA